MDKHFGVKKNKIEAYYSGEYIRDGRFHLLEYVRDYFQEGWRSSIISPLDDFDSIKRTVSFDRILTAAHENNLQYIDV